MFRKIIFVPTVGRRANQEVKGVAEPLSTAEAPTRASFVSLLRAPEESTPADSPVPVANGTGRASAQAACPPAAGRRRRPAPGAGPPRSTAETVARLDGLLRQARTALDGPLPVCRDLAAVLPDGGLRRGMTVSVTASGTLLVTLIAAASEAGSWCAVVGLPTLGLLACAEAGVCLERLLLAPGVTAHWPRVTATLLEGCDITVVAPGAPVTASLARRLSARARAHRSVLVGYGADWPGADVVLSPTGSAWHGIGAGRGRLRGRELGVTVTGRRAAQRPRRTTLTVGTPLPASPASRIAA